MEPGGSEDFAIASVPAGSTVAPGDRVTIDVTYAPRDAGGDNGSILIESDDVDENPLTVSLCGRGVPRPRFRRGDANVDAVTDIADAIFTLSYLFADGASPTCLDAADANDDGQVDIADPVAILGHLFAGAGDLPEPFAECGTDPTEDAVGCVAYPGC